MTRHLARSLALHTLVAAPLLVAAAAAPASAQDRGERAAGRSLVLALPDHFPAADAVSMLVRTPELDVVVLQPGDLSVEAAAMALSLLRRIAAREPVPAGGSVIPITGYSMLTPPDEAERARLAAALLRLERAPVSRLGDLVPGRWTRLGR